MHRQTKTMGYGVMVTLQILVLSFLVRIQVAQLNDSLSRVVFFVRLALGVVGGRTMCDCYWCYLCNDASISRGSINSPAALFHQPSLAPSPRV